MVFPNFLRPLVLSTSETHEPTGYTSLLIITSLRFTCGEREICSTIKKSQNIMNMTVDFFLAMFDLGKSGKKHPSRVFYKKTVSKSFSKFTGKHPCGSLVLLQLHTLIFCSNVVPKDSLAEVSSCKIQTSFLKERLR